MKRLLLIIAAIWSFAASANAEQTIRVLAVGNSFSVNVVEQNLN